MHEGEEESTLEAKTVVKYCVIKTPTRPTFDIGFLDGRVATLVSEAEVVESRMKRQCSHRRRG